MQSGLNTCIRRRERKISNDKSYQKECIFCRNKIKMSKETGKWLPFELQGGKVHDCKERQQDDTKLNGAINQIEKENQRPMLTVDEIVRRLSSVGIEIDFDLFLKGTSK
jgi:hypothetical protein